MKISEKSRWFLIGVVVAPYFVPTVFPLLQVRNYLGMPPGAVEYISNKDEFELGKEGELRSIGVHVKFVDPLRDPSGRAYSADEIRRRIVAGEDVSSAIAPPMHALMTKSNLYSAIQSRVFLMEGVEA